MNKKLEIITFKVDESLMDALKGIPNRSAFIRSAILSALENACPLCKGTGILTPNQKEHWERFAQDHSLEECRECHEIHLVCARNMRKDGHGMNQKAKPARKRTTA
jgi:hypothetical protein